MARPSRSLGWVLGIAVVFAVSAAVWLSRSPTPAAAAAVPAPERPGASLLEDPAEIAIPATRADADSAEERVAVAVDSSSATLHLRLVVWPGARPLGPGFVEFELDGEATIRPVTAEGRTEVPRPRTESPLVVRADGYHDTQLAVAELRGRSEVEVVLRPRQGLFGRVVDVEGRPVPDVAVALTADSIELRGASISGDAARANLLRRGRTVAVDRTDAQGWYAFEVRTDRALEPLHLRAYQDVDRTAEREVVLPRGDESLEDLVLVPLPRVEVRVVDEGGAPIAGVRFWPNLPRRGPGDDSQRGPWETGADGTCRVPVYRFPDTLFPHDLACVPVGRRIDGVDVGPQVELERPEQRLEWVCRVVEGVRLFVRDGVTGETVVQPRLTLAAFAGAQRVATLSWINADSAGAYIYGFHEPGDESEPLKRAPLYDRIELTVDEQGYHRIEGRVLTRAQLPPGGEYELVLQPLGSFHVISGRVVDAAGAPLPGVTVRVTGIGSAPLARGTDRGRGSAQSDAEGRFRTSWSTETAGLSVVVYCSDPRAGRFAYVGPLDPAAAQELELRVGKPLSVPFVLESDLSDDALFVRVTPLDLADPLPLFASEVRTRRATDGTRRGVLSLPAAERVSVFAYALAEGRQTYANPVGVEFDPTAPQLPLRLSVARSAIRLSGRVAADDPSTVRSCAVVAVHRGERSSTGDSQVIGLRDGDAFQCDVPSAGAWSLLLVEPVGSQGGTVVGRLDLDVVADREGLVLVANSD